ncbi:MAG: hypothetical protein KF819_09120, partial [Labilithrix sp.]|nr:hypothetical protein [Labilithrix sp.]
AVAGAAPAPATTQNREPLPMGVIHVDPALRVVQVDGQFRRVNNGTVVVSCGRHKLKAGMSESIVDVPCNN